MSFSLVTKPNRPWFLKLSIFTVVLLGFGMYGLYDAKVAYPNRGINHASYMLFQYLEAAKAEGWPDSRVGVADPVAELKALTERGGEKLTGVDAAKYGWLRSLSIVDRLKPEFTRIENRERLYGEMKARWTTGEKARSAPKPLAAYDIPVQWLFTFIGFGGGAVLGLHVLRVIRRKYRYDPEAKALQLPDGSTLTPADIEDFDKRKWEKFLVFLKIKPGHTPHGGKELKLDLYQHAPLEAWVLEMESIAFPDRQAPAAAPAMDPGQPGGAS